MKVYVVAMPWQDQRATLQAVVVAATVHGWDLTVSSDLVVAPAWARYNYHMYVPTEPLPQCTLLVWLTPLPVPITSAWVITTHDGYARARWVGTPSVAHWHRTEDAGSGYVLHVPNPAPFFQALAEGRGDWPEGTWTGPTLPGRLCPVEWWSPGGWRVLGTHGVERIK